MKTIFSLEDIENAFNAAKEKVQLEGTTRDVRGTDFEIWVNKYRDSDEYIQSLSTQQLPKEFVLGKGEGIEEQIKNGYYEY